MFSKNVMRSNLRGRGRGRRGRGRGGRMNLAGRSIKTVRYAGIDMRKGLIGKFKAWMLCIDRLSEEERDQFFTKHFVVNAKIDDMKIVKEKYPGNSDLPYLSAPKEIKILKDRKSIDKWIRRNIYEMRVKEIGIDTEFDAIKVYGPRRFNFVKTYLPDLIQISTNESVLLIHLSEGGLAPPQLLVEILADKLIRKSFCNVFNDYLMMNNWLRHHGYFQLDIPRCELPRKKMNLQGLSPLIFKKFNFYDVDPNMKGLGRLCEMYLKLKMKKDPHVTISRWSRKELSEEQIEYASMDPYATLLLSKNEARRCTEHVHRSKIVFQKEINVSKRRSIHRFFQDWVKVKKEYYKKRIEEEMRRGNKRVVNNDLLEDEGDEVDELFEDDDDDDFFGEDDEEEEENEGEGDSQNSQQQQQQHQHQQQCQYYSRNQVLVIQTRSLRRKDGTNIFIFPKTILSL